MASDLAMRQKIAEALQPFANADELPRLARTLPGIVSNVLEEGLHCRAGMASAGII